MKIFELLCRLRKDLNRETRPITCVGCVLLLILPSVALYGLDTQTSINIVDAQNVLSPLDSSQVIGKLNNLLAGKILKQISVSKTDKSNCLIVEELYLDPKHLTGKRLFKTVTGNTEDLTYLPSALDVKPDAAVVVNSQGVFRIDRSTGKWVLQIEKPSMDIFRNGIRNCFVETMHPFAELMGIYYKEYLQYQKLSLPGEATKLLNEINMIKHPGSTYSFSSTPSGEHKQEFSFYDNEIVKELRFINAGKTTGKIVNEVVDPVDFSVPDTELQGFFKPNQPLYNRLVKGLDQAKLSNKKAFGFWLDASGQTSIIKNIASNSPAYKAGLKPGDTILSVRGHSTAGISSDDVLKLLADGDSAVLEIKESDGTLRTIKIDKDDEINFMDGAGKTMLAYPR